MFRTVKIMTLGLLRSSADDWRRRHSKAHEYYPADDLGRVYVPVEWRNHIQSIFNVRLSCCEQGFPQSLAGNPLASRIGTVAEAWFSNGMK